MTADRVTVRPLGEADLDALIALAASVWRAHYTGIITSAQIEYMLDQRYRLELLREELRLDHVWWDVLASENSVRGFASCLLTEEPGELKLDKLYVHQDWQRLGYGAMLLERVLERARERACRHVILAVNKRNLRAITAYRKWGFEIERALVTDIGGGFVMDDYIMVRPV